MHTPTSLDDILSQRHDAQRAVVNVDEPQLKLVVFALGGQWFAFHGSSVREILAQPTVHFVPGCPSSLEGVIHVRGDIESVLRLHELPLLLGLLLTWMLGTTGRRVVAVLLAVLGAAMAAAGVAAALAEGTDPVAGVLNKVKALGDAVRSVVTSASVAETV